MNTTQFTATAHSTVQDKQKFAAHFKRFILAGCPPKLFHKWFYQRLSLCFGMIAHYNQQGFYDTYFTGLNGRLQFVSECLAWPCYGDPAYTYSDVEQYLQEWLKVEHVYDILREAVAHEKEQREIEERDKLIAKHGLPPYEIKREQA